MSVYTRRFDLLLSVVYVCVFVCVNVGEGVSCDCESLYAKQDLLDRPNIQYRPSEAKKSNFIVLILLYKFHSSFYISTQTFIEFNFKTRFIKICYKFEVKIIENN